MEKKLYKCYVCGSNNLTLLKIISQKPENETYFDFDKDRYYREIKKCGNCKVYNNFYDMDLDDIYSFKYNFNTYRADIKLHFNNLECASQLYGEKSTSYYELLSVQ